MLSYIAAIRSENAAESTVTYAAAMEARSALLPETGCVLCCLASLPFSPLGANPQTGITLDGILRSSLATLPDPVDKLGTFVVSSRLLK